MGEVAEIVVQSSLGFVGIVVPEIGQNGDSAIDFPRQDGTPVDLRERAVGLGENSFARHALCQGPSLFAI